MTARLAAWVRRRRLCGGCGPSTCSCRTGASHADVLLRIINRTVNHAYGYRYSYEIVQIAQQVISSAECCVIHVTSVSVEPGVSCSAARRVPQRHCGSCSALRTGNPQQRHSRLPSSGPSCSRSPRSRRLAGAAARAGLLPTPRLTQQRTAQQKQQMPGPSQSTFCEAGRGVRHCCCWQPATSRLRRCLWR